MTIFRRPVTGAERITALTDDNTRLHNRITALTARLTNYENALSDAQKEIEGLHAELEVLRPVGAAPASSTPLSDGERRELARLRLQVKALEDRLNALTIASMERDMAGVAR